MNNSVKKIIALSLSGAMVIGLSACNNEGGGSNATGGGNETFAEATAPPIDEKAPTGNVTYLTYETDFESSNQVNLAKFETELGGTIEIITSGSGNEYFEKLGTLVASGSSPDLVRYEWRSFPHGMSYNMYTPLESYIDINSDLWKDMKPVADQFKFNGHYYYFPNELKTNFALNYNQITIENGNLDDPMKLLAEDKWTWTAFEKMLKDWCDKDPNHIGYNGVGGMAFVLTTGKKVVEVNGSDIINNLRDADVTRCMQWLEKLHKGGLTGVTEEQTAATSHSNGYESPQAAFVDGNLLFLGMDPSWTYPAAKEELDKQGKDNDMRFVPFPRDDNSTTYYHGIDTIGFLVPNGAKNIKGAVDWINFIHTQATDPENLAKAKEDALDDRIVYKSKCLNKECGDTSENADSKGRHIFTDEENEAGVDTCPVCGTPREESYKVVWNEDVYDLWLELKSTDGRFNMLFDNCYGFNDDVDKLFQNGETPLIDGPVFGDFSYTQLCEANYNVVEGYLQQYRDRLKEIAEKEAAEGNAAATTPAA